MSSTHNVLAGLNLADLTSLLQGRLAGAAAPAPSARPLNLSGQAIPQYLLAAAKKAGSPVGAAPIAAATAAVRRPAADPPGSRADEGGSPSAVEAPLNMTSALAVVQAAALNRKRSATLLTTAEQANTLADVAPVAKKPRKDRSWDEMFGALVSYKARRNSTAVPLVYPEDPELGLWVEDQKRRKDVLTAEERYKLDLIAFDWKSSAATGTPSRATIGVPALASLALRLPTTNKVSAATSGSASTRNIFDALAEYKQKIHASTPASQLQNTLIAPPTKLLPEVDEAQQHWNRMFIKLQAHKTLHGHCNVLLTNPDPALGLWVLKQRGKYQQNTIPKEHRALLDALGFERDGLIGAAASAPVKPLSSASSESEAAKEQPEIKERKRVRTFDENFKCLLEYKAIHGNVDVPQKYEKDRKLGIWVKNVRQHPQRHSEEQRARLDSIGFKWRKLQLDEQWNDAFKQLLDYKEKYGDCNVPSRWKKCPALARWVHTQRTMYRRNKLLDDRKEKLEDAGFVWDCNAMRDDEAFHENYEKLQAFKKEKGHCNIPNKYRRDRPLGRWAAKMRDLYHFDQLDADRKKALSDINFVWKPPLVESSEADKEMSGSASQASSDDESDKGSVVDYV